jgi:membrane protein implicated in regulation of membrane protease activity
MYGALWRVLPGPWWVRVLLLVVLAVLLVWALVTWVFPIVDQYLAPQEATVGE